LPPKLISNRENSGVLSLFRYIAAPEVHGFQRVALVFRALPLAIIFTIPMPGLSILLFQETLFGFMTMSMGGLWIRCVGLVRAEAQIIMKNLAYNMRRYCVLARI